MCKLPIVGARTQDAEPMAWQYEEARLTADVSEPTERAIGRQPAGLQGQAMAES